MASPSNINSRDITGKYVLVSQVGFKYRKPLTDIDATQNRSLSTNTEMDHILEYQGMGWLKRKAASHVTVSIAVKHVEDDEGVERIEIFQTLPGGLGRTELRILDWKTQTQESEILGPILAQTRRVQLGDIEDGFLKSNWLPEAVEHGLIETYGASDTVKSGKVWTLNQVRLHAHLEVTRL